MNTENDFKAVMHVSKKKMFLMALLFIAVLTCAVFVVIHFVMRADREPGALLADPNAQVGSLTVSEEERLAALQRVVDEGMVNFSINATPYFKNTISEGNIMVENSAGSQNRFTVKILLDQTGETVYESGAILPDQYIENCRLLVSLDPGTYPCTAYFTTYALDEDRYIGQAGAKITLYVDSL